MNEGWQEETIGEKRMMRYYLYTVAAGVQYCRHVIRSSAIRVADIIWSVVRRASVVSLLPDRCRLLD